MTHFGAVKKMLITDINLGLLSFLTTIVIYIEFTSVSNKNLLMKKKKGKVLSFIWTNKIVKNSIINATMYEISMNSKASLIQQMEVANLDTLYSPMTHT